jgi:hypothetical protein
MEIPFDLAKILPLLIPVLLIQFGMQIYALIDLYRQPQVKGPKWVWALVIILGELLGPIIYFIFARKEE